MDALTKKLVTLLPVGKITLADARSIKTEVIHKKNLQNVGQFKKNESHQIELTKKHKSCV